MLLLSGNYVADRPYYFGYGHNLPAERLSAIVAPKAAWSSSSHWSTEQIKLNVLPVPVRGGLS